MNAATTPKTKITAPSEITAAATGAGTEAVKPAAVRKRANKRAAPAQPAAKTSPNRTKTARIIALLERSSGASLKTLMKATGWQAHSVRGFLSGQLGKRMGLRVKSVEKDGQRLYSIRK